jgi:hypothetical protein
MHVTGVDAVAETAALRTQMAQMLDEAIASYPAEEQPPGSWWLPASHGGSAPTLEEAIALDGAEKRERARKRAEKRANKKTKR